MIIEIAGLPRCGKSVTCDTLFKYYTRKGYTTHVTEEKSKTSCIPTLKRVDYAYWSAFVLLPNY